MARNLCMLVGTDSRGVGGGGSDAPVLRNRRRAPIWRFKAISRFIPCSTIVELGICKSFTLLLLAGPERALAVPYWRGDVWAFDNHLSSRRLYRGTDFSSVARTAVFIYL